MNLPKNLSKYYPVFGESLQAPNNTKPKENTISNSYFARFNKITKYEFNYLPQNDR
jgi:hypothetical protein